MGKRFPHRFRFVAWMIALLLFAEAVLRLWGFEPGSYLTRQDRTGLTVRFDLPEVFPLPFFVPDSLGIIRMNRDSVRAAMPRAEAFVPKFRYYFDSVATDAYGFRIAPPDTGHRQTVLLLGDSYTWGYSARPVDSCFADRLQRLLPGHRIVNAGLPGVDVVTYRDQLEWLIGRERPALVVVNFFAGNDFIFYDKKLQPFEHNDLFLTNAGGLMKVNYDSYGTDTVEVFEGPLDAYRYVRNQVFIPRDRSWSGVVGRSALLTQAYRLVRPGSDRYRDVQVRRFPKDPLATRKCLDSIRDICRRNGTDLILSVIPDETDMTPASMDQLTERLDAEFPSDPPYMLIRNLDPGDYAPEGFDTHFNNSGHRKYALFLYERIRTRMSAN